MGRRQGTDLYRNPTMGSRSSTPPLPVPREPSHPIECLRIIQLPGCIVCARPSAFYCGGCPESPAFCSSDHFLEVLSRLLIPLQRPLTPRSRSTGPRIQDPVIGILHTMRLTTQTLTSGPHTPIPAPLRWAPEARTTMRYHLYACPSLPRIVVRTTIR